YRYADRRGFAAATTWSFDEVYPPRGECTFRRRADYFALSRGQIVGDDVRAICRVNKPGVREVITQVLHDLDHALRQGDVRRVPHGLDEAHFQVERRKIEAPLIAPQLRQFRFRDAVSSFHQVDVPLHVGLGPCLRLAAVQTVVVAET